MIIHEITETAIRRSLNNLTITFQDFQLSESLMKAINRMGFEEATPIQAETIPLGLQNKDVIGQAQTGTGKTAAFGIPLVEKIDPASPNIQAIIIAPTRELAIQVSEELYKITKTSVRAYFRFTVDKISTAKSVRSRKILISS